MLSKDLHPARRAFRKVLLGLLACSVLILLSVIGMRIYYYDGHIDGTMQTALFEYDIIQHKARALVADDAGDMVIINELFRLSIFSPIYYHAGYKMLEDKANTGYVPATLQLASMNN